jgi:hypothetical protein
MTRSIVRHAAFAVIGALMLAAPPRIVDAQQAVRRGASVASDVSVKIWIPAGMIRLVAWERDSIAVEGTIPKGETFFFGGAGAGAKMGMDDPPPGREAQPVNLVISLPRAARVSVRTITGSIDANDISGSFNTVAGNITIGGTAQDIQAEAMDGAIRLTVSAPYVRARSGSGTVTIGGRIQDLAAATVSGAMTITSQGIERGRFESVTGAMVLASPLERAATIDVDNHGGPVELRVPANILADFDLTSVAGSITNHFNKRQPIAGRGGRGQDLAFTTSPKGVRIVVRTFKGAITLRAQ